MRPSLPRSFSLLALLLPLGVLGAAGCRPLPEAANANPPVELRTYSIPQGYAGDVRTALRQAFGDDGVGRVSDGPNGQIFVLAPATVHRGIEAFVKDLAAAPGPPAGPSSVTIEYWIVLGAPDPAGRLVADDERLGPVAGALERIVAEEGRQRFELLERLRLSSMGHDFAQITGRLAMIQQRATVAQGAIVAELQIGLRQHRLQTQVKLDPGQMVVLGETGVDETWGEGPAQKGRTLYYLIAARTE